MSRIGHKWHIEKRRIKMFIVHIIALLDKMSMLFSIPTDEIWNCFAVQWGDQQYLWRLPEIDQRGINHTEAGCGLHKWNRIPSKCKCTTGLETCFVIHAAYFPEYYFNAHNIFLPIRNSHLLKHRTVLLRRQANGGLGLSIKVSRYVLHMERIEWKYKVFCLSRWPSSSQFVLSFSFLLHREAQNTTCP